MSAALIFREVVKRFGTRAALDGLSFSIPTGSITGFVGPNGAGKTTTFSVVSGFLLPDAGQIEILGLPAFDPFALKGRLGVLPQDAALPDRHTPHELLTHLGRLQGMPARAARREAERVLTAVRLADRIHARIASLSHGMRRRVAVASALLGTPELVLLDEPMAGLDPIQAHGLRDTLAQLRGRHTLVVSSHNLDELERLCDYVVMIDAGRRLREGPIERVTGEHELVTWQLTAPVPLDRFHEQLPGHRFELAGTILTQIAKQGDLDRSSITIMGILADVGVGIRAVRRGKGLENRFLEDARR